VPPGAQNARKKYEYMFKTPEGALVSAAYYFRYSGFAFDSGELVPYLNGAPLKAISLKQHVRFDGQTLSLVNRDELVKMTQEMLSPFGRVVDQTVTGKCPSCGAMVKASMKKGSTTCEYCGTHIDVKQLAPAAAPAAAPPPVPAAPVTAYGPSAPAPQPAYPAAQGKLCVTCSSPLQPSWKICPNCGTPSALPCAGCGTPLQPTWKMCPNCGRAVG